MDKRFLVLFTSVIFLSGCNNQLENFVKVEKPPTETPTPKPPVQSGAGGGVKWSPGHVTATGGPIGATITVTPTNQVLKGSTIGMQVGISRSAAR